MTVWHWLLVALVAVGLPVFTLYATHTVGSQHRAERRRVEYPLARRAEPNRDPAFYRKRPKRQTR